jgi:hypothetical protein
MHDILGLSGRIVSEEARRRWLNDLVVNPDPSFRSFVHNFVFPSVLRTPWKHAHIQAQTHACAQAAREAMKLAWDAQHDGDDDPEVVAIVAAQLEKAVSDEEYIQRKLSGLPGEKEIKAASTGSIPAMLILIKYIHLLLESVLPCTFSPFVV